MVRITIELIRKRSEHNEGEIHSLEELALHQEKIEKIEMLDKWCRGLKILLLQNNLIPKIENVGRLKQLEYLNLALNNIQVIENLSGCESLKKLDLTLNFIGQLSSVILLKNNRHLENLYLVGNPCVDFKGYREYVITMLPQLKTLDGLEISKSERIKAKQKITIVAGQIASQEKDYLAMHINDADCKSDSDNFGLETGDEGEESQEDFWSKTTKNTIAARIELQKQMEKQENEKNPKEPVKEKIPRKLETSDGRMLNINEAKVSFSLNDEYTRNILVLDISLPKYMDSSLIDVNIESTYVRVTIKGKIFQLVLPEEVLTGSSFAQRSKTTGHLVITMPKLHETSTKIWTGGSYTQDNKVGATSSGKEQIIDVAATKNRINRLQKDILPRPTANGSKSTKSPSSAAVKLQPKKKTIKKGCKACTATSSGDCNHYRDDPNVPPLI